MTKSYFKQVPDFEYVTRTQGNTDISNYITVKNLFKRGRIRPDIFGNLSFFTKYKIIGNDRPETIGIQIPNPTNVDETKIYDQELISNLKNRFREWKTGWKEEHVISGEDFDEEKIGRASCRERV